MVQAGQHMSQAGQHLVLSSLFKLIGTTNKQYVEFGYNTNEICGYTGPNTCMMWRAGWTGLLMDGGHQNESINLQREMISSVNIASLFRKHSVPRDVDYVSVDIDSSDIWVLDRLLEEYAPRVVSCEYNSNVRRACVASRAAANGRSARGWCSLWPPRVRVMQPGVLRGCCAARSWALAAARVAVPLELRPHVSGRGPFALCP